MGSDRAAVNEPVSAAEQKALAGTYSFGQSPRDRFVVDTQRDQLGITRVGATRRNLLHSGGLIFHPVGASSVRITFEVAGDRASAVAVSDGDLVVRAVRAS
jgi:hypothetical protein